MKRALSCFAASVMTVLALGHASALGASRPASGGAVQPPAVGAYLGATVGARNGLNSRQSRIQFESEIGRKLGILHRYHGWSDHDYSPEAGMIANGYIPMISWRPVDNMTADPNRAAEINNGQWDSLIATSADGMKALGAPVLLRWDWEMDLGPTSPENVGSASQFIAAWQRIYGIFQAHGATNVSFVWAPHAGGFGGTAQTFYPGDAYVDWIGASAVQTTRGSFNSFTTIYSKFYAWSSQRSKPLLIWVGVPENPGDATYKPGFFSDAETTISTQWTAVKAFVYFNAQPGVLNYWADTTAASLAAFKAMGCDPYFNPSSAC